MAVIGIEFTSRFTEFLFFALLLAIVVGIAWLYRHMRLSESLLTIVRRENARYFERRRLETVDIDNLTASQAALLAEGPDEELNDLRESIFELDDDYREPLVLQVLMGYSTTEIGEMMGLKQGAVLTRLHRARLKLKENVAQEDRL